MPFEQQARQADFACHHRAKCFTKLNHVHWGPNSDCCHSTANSYHEVHANSTPLQADSDICLHSLPRGLQADDDSYVRVGEVLSRIEQAPQHKMFMGFIENPGGGPHRNPSSQWYVTVEEWPSERYPPWAHGAGYVLSQVGS